MSWSRITAQIQATLEDLSPMTPITQPVIPRAPRYVPARHAKVDFTPNPDRKHSRGRRGGDRDAPISHLEIDFELQHADSRRGDRWKTRAREEKSRTKAFKLRGFRKPAKVGSKLDAKHGGRQVDTTRNVVLARSHRLKAGTETPGKRQRALFTEFGLQQSTLKRAPWDARRKRAQSQTPAQLGIKLVPANIKIRPLNRSQLLTYSDDGIKRRLSIKLYTKTLDQLPEADAARLRAVIESALQRGGIEMNPGPPKTDPTLPRNARFRAGRNARKKADAEGDALPPRTFKVVTLKPKFEASVCPDLNKLIPLGSEAVWRDHGLFNCRRCGTNLISTPAGFQHERDVDAFGPACDPGPINPPPAPPSPTLAEVVACVESPPTPPVCTSSIQVDVLDPPDNPVEPPSNDVPPFPPNLKGPEKAKVDTSPILEATKKKLKHVSQKEPRLLTGMILSEIEARDVMYRRYGDPHLEIVSEPEPRPYTGEDRPLVDRAIPICPEDALEVTIRCKATNFFDPYAAPFLNWAVITLIDIFRGFRICLHLLPFFLCAPTALSTIVRVAFLISIMRSSTLRRWLLIPALIADVSTSSTWLYFCLCACTRLQYITFLRRGFVHEYRLVYSPHLLTCALLDCSLDDPDTFKKNSKSRVRRVTSYPLPQKIAVSLIEGTDLCANAVARTRGFCIGAGQVTRDYPECLLWDTDPMKAPYHRSRLVSLALRLLRPYASDTRAALSALSAVPDAIIGMTNSCTPMFHAVIRPARACWSTLSRAPWTAATALRAGSTFLLHSLRPCALVVVGQLHLFLTHLSQRPSLGGDLLTFVAFVLATSLATHLLVWIGTILVHKCVALPSVLLVICLSLTKMSWPALAGSLVVG